MCCELLSKPALANTPDILTADEDLPIDCGKPTRTEIRKAIKQLMNSKVAGADVIPVEVLKLDAQMLYGLFGKSEKKRSLQNRGMVS